MEMYYHSSLPFPRGSFFLLGHSLTTSVWMRLTAWECATLLVMMLRRFSKLPGTRVRCCKEEKGLSIFDLQEDISILILTCPQPLSIAEACRSQRFVGHLLAAKPFQQQPPREFLPPCLLSVCDTEAETFPG